MSNDNVDLKVEIEDDQEGGLGQTKRQKALQNFIKQK
jgi:hypothetical protein